MSKNIFKLSSTTSTLLLSLTCYVQKIILVFANNQWISGPNNNAITYQAINKKAMAFKQISDFSSYRTILGDKYRKYMALPIILKVILKQIALAFHLFILI